jgi:hypothetical protein
MLLFLLLYLLVVGLVTLALLLHGQLSRSTELRLTPGNGQLIRDRQELLIVAKQEADTVFQQARERMAKISWSTSGAGWNEWSNATLVTSRADARLVGRNPRRLGGDALDL